MGRTSDAASFGKGLVSALQPYIDARYERGLKVDEAKVYAERLVNMSELPEGFTEDDTNFLIGEMSRTVDPRTLQATLNYAASGRKVLKINMGSDQGGNRLGESNIHWKIPALNPNRTQKDRQRSDWLVFHNRVNALKTEGMSLNDATTQVLAKMMKADPLQVTGIHEYINGDTAKTYVARQQMAASVGLLFPQKNMDTNKIEYHVNKYTKDNLKELGLLNTPEDLALDPNSPVGKARLLEIALYNTKSPAYNAYNAYAHRGVLGDSQAAVELIQNSSAVAAEHAQALEVAMSNIISQEDIVPESSAEIPKSIMARMQKDNIINPVVLNNLISNAGQQPEEFIRRIAIRYVPDNNQQELRDLIYKYLYSLAEDD